MNKSIAIYIGRFSPAHNGHISVISAALATHDKILIILGSANQPRTTRDPFTVEERTEILKLAIVEKLGSTVLNSRVEFHHVEDFPYNDTLWLNQVNKIIDKCQLEHPEHQIYLTGADRDKSTFYLKMFPQLKKDLIKYDTSTSLDLSSTLVRELYFGSTFKGVEVDSSTAKLLKLSFLPMVVVEYMKRFEETPEYANLKAEFDYIKTYRSQFKSLKYPPTFVTIDAVVTQGGSVLMIKRRSTPGKGLWALPGGFLEQDERLIDGAIRELREETKLRVPVPVLRGSIIGKEVFDKPDRSERGRTITIAYHFKLVEADKLPEIKAGSDAQGAEWMLISRLTEMRDQIFEDHYSIITTMVLGTST